MTDEAVRQSFEAVLTARAEELRRTIASTEASSGPVAPDKAIGRLTRVDAMQQASMQSALHRSQLTELRLVERALAAMAKGTYGICTRCGDSIAEARLRAKPEAYLCLACADRTPRR
jgi:DnaK suppressor protein